MVTKLATPVNSGSSPSVSQIPLPLNGVAVIPTVRNSCCYGLFQIYYGANKASLNSWGITSAAQLYDPQVNAYAAYAMYLRANGWGPWAM